MRLTKNYGYLNKDLDQIEKALNATMQANHPVLYKASTQLLNAGGKRIRPVFVLLAGQFGNYDIDKMKLVAVSLELIHMASLVHDDVIDDAELRRGEATVKQLYDNRVAMYAGDYILARSLETITKLRKPRAHQVLASTIVEVCIGEIEQIKDKYDWNQNLRNYLRRIKRKTAILIAASCKLGAIAADVDDLTAHRLYQYGYYIGMSYQIIDDILDFTSSQEQLGKPVGNDLLQGNMTLPVLFAMCNPTFKQTLAETFHNPENVTSDQMEHLLAMLKQTDAIKQSYELSDHYLQKAWDILDTLPNKRAKRTLLSIGKYLGKRRS